MATYKRKIIINNPNRVILSDLPFQPGQQVEITLTTTDTQSIDVELEVNFLRDRKDAKFLACAIVSNAQFLITGDRDFAEAQRLLNTTIVSVNQFKRLVM